MQMLAGIQKFTSRIPVFSVNFCDEQMNKVGNVLSNTQWSQQWMITVNAQSGHRFEQYTMLIVPPNRKIAEQKNYPSFSKISKMHFCIPNHTSNCIPNCISNCIPNCNTETTQEIALKLEVSFAHHKNWLKKLVFLK